MSLKALSCNILRNSSPILSSEFVIIADKPKDNTLTGSVPGQDEASRYAYRVLGSSGYAGSGIDHYAFLVLSWRGYVVYSLLDMVYSSSLQISSNVFILVLELCLFASSSQVTLELLHLSSLKQLSAKSCNNYIKVGKTGSEARREQSPIAAHEEERQYTNMTRDKLYIQAEKEAIFLILTAPVTSKIESPSFKQSSSHEHCTTHKKQRDSQTITLNLSQFLRKTENPEQAQGYGYAKRTLGTPLLSILRAVFHSLSGAADWLEDTDEEIDEQELEAHYSYMAKIQMVSPADQVLLIPNVNSTKPRRKMMFCHVRHIPEATRIHKRYIFLEKDDSNVIPDSSNICTNDNQSIQTIHMLAPKCATYHGRSTFANPKYLKKAQSDKPRLYEIPYDTLIPGKNRFSPMGKDTVTLE
ncbi:hypothetical protein Tco_1458374 [Tanacetum coccineum]